MATSSLMVSMPRRMSLTARRRIGKPRIMAPTKALIPATWLSVPANHSMKKELAMNTTPATMVVNRKFVCSWS